MDLSRDEAFAVCHALTWSLEKPFFVLPRPNYTEDEINLMDQIRSELLLHLSAVSIDDPRPIHLDSVFNEPKLRVCYLALCVFIAEIGYSDLECMVIASLSIAQFVGLIQKLRASVLSSM
jgi:hypothetical protein